MFIRVSLVAIETVRLAMGCSASRRSVFADGDGYFEEIRTERESGVAGIRDVHFKAHFGSVHDELDHASALREAGNIADGEDVRLVESRKCLSQARILGSAYE